MQAAEHFGAITLRDGSAKAKVQLLPFDGDAYGVFAFVESTLLLNEPQSSELLSLTQRLMINPMVRSAAAELIAERQRGGSLRLTAAPSRHGLADYVGPRARPAPRDPGASCRRDPPRPLPC